MIDSHGGAQAAANQYEDTSQVEKYIMSEHEYNDKDDAFHKFMAKQRAADPEFCKKWGFKEPAKKIEAGFCKEQADTMKADDRR